MTYPHRKGQIMVYTSGQPAEEITLNTNDTTIINKEDYKLVVKLTQLNLEDHMLTISHWLPELGWQHKQLILSTAELKLFKDSL